MSKKHDRALLSRKGLENNFSYPPTRKNTTDSINKYSFNIIINSELSRAEYLFSLVDKFKILQPILNNFLSRLYTHGLEKLVVISTDTLENFSAFLRIYFKTYGIWVPWIDARSWVLVLESLANLKTRYLAGAQEV